MIVHCKACNHEWEISLTAPTIEKGHQLGHTVMVSTFTKQLIRQAIHVMRATAKVGCPRCAANGNAVLVGATPHSLHCTEVLDASSIRGDLYAMQSRLALVDAEVTARHRRNASRAVVK